MTHPPHLQRVCIVGTSGSGKTSLADQLAWALGAGWTRIELDALHWEPGWTEAPDDVFRERVRAACAAPRWILDGNYSVTRDLTWGRATAVIWLNYPRHITWSRIVRRTIRRILTREPLWHDNRESLRMALSRDSIILWSIKTWRKNRATIPAALAKPDFAHLHVIELTHPAQATALLSSLPTHHTP